MEVLYWEGFGISLSDARGVIGCIHLHCTFVIIYKLVLVITCKAWEHKKYNEGPTHAPINPPKKH